MSYPGQSLSSHREEPGPLSAQRNFIAQVKGRTLAELQQQESRRYRSCRRSCWSSVYIGSEGVGEGAMLHFCYLEVGHVHSAAFVINDSSINHGRGSVNAQWLCSAGGLSLWMPGLQPLCSTRVLPTFLFLLSLSALPRWNGSPCMPSVHIRLSPLSFSSSNSLFPCPWNFSLNYKPALTFPLKSWLSWLFQHLKHLWLSSYQFVSLPVSTVQPLSFFTVFFHPISFPLFPRWWLGFLRYTQQDLHQLSAS